MTDEPRQHEKGEGESGRAHGPDDPRERLRQFERERGFEKSPPMPESPGAPEEDDVETEEDGEADSPS